MCPSPGAFARAPAPVSSREARVPGHAPGLLVLAQLIVHAREGHRDRRLDPRLLGELPFDRPIGVGEGLDHRGRLPRVLQVAPPPSTSSTTKATMALASAALIGLLAGQVGLVPLPCHLAEGRPPRSRPSRSASSRVLGQPLGRVARTACQVLTPCRRPGPGRPARRSSAPPGCAGRTSASRYHADGGQASTGSSVRYRTHVGREVAGRLVPPRAVLLQRLHHDPVELAAHELAQPRGLGPGDWPRRSSSVAPSVLSRVLGLGGSSSRMIRRISSKAALRNVSWSNGVVPVSSS